MSQFEVFLTGSQSLYQFTGIKEQQVRVMKIEEYILRKYEINEKMAYPLYYYYRQTYSIEKNIFYPEILPRICYCQEIFNPDIPFKKCICGNIFHPDCLLQTNSEKCWSKICNYNCNNLLSDEEQIKKIKLLYGDTQKEIKNITKDTDVDDFKNDFLNKKTHRPKNNGDKKLLYIINKEESNNPEKEKDKTEIIKDEDNTDIPRKEKEKDKTEIIKDENNTDIPKEKREKGISIIYENLIKVKEILEKDKNILEKYQKYKDNEIYKFIKEGEQIDYSFHLKQLSEKIEENLYKKYYNTASFYYNYLRVFNKYKQKSIDLLIKIILGEFTPEKISEFTEIDFLSAKQKTEKEKKNKEINTTIIKKNDSELNLISNKGRMLSEKEKNNEEKNNKNEYLYRNDENECNQKNLDYKEKEKQKNPNLSKNDAKILIQLKAPNEESIKQKLNDLIQNNFEQKEQNILNVLEKEVKKSANKEEK